MYSDHRILISDFVEDANRVNDKNTQAPGMEADHASRAEGDAESSLGRFLSSARERRGLTHEGAIKDSHIPGHYLRMLESNDYSMISDRLYLMPFLRRYATFLGLDPEEIAMRFVREVQRADNSPPMRIDEPLRGPRGKWPGWLGIVGAVALIAIVCAYMLTRQRGDTRTPAPAASAPTAPQASSRTLH
jgi:cytoskeletal protein RodZ